MTRPCPKRDRTGKNGRLPIFLAVLLFFLVSPSGGMGKKTEGGPAMPHMLCTLTAAGGNHLDPQAIAKLWETLLARNDYESVAVNLCPFGVPLFLEPGTQPVDMPKLDDGTLPVRRVINWWEGVSPAPGPCLRVTLDPAPDARPYPEEEHGRPAAGGDEKAMRRIEQELSAASGLSFTANHAKDEFMRGWEDKGVVIFPVDFSFRPDPARLARAWVWLDSYLRGAAVPTPDVEKHFHFMDADWIFIPAALPSHYHFDRMFWWNPGGTSFFQPEEIHPRCPFCNAEISFDYVGERLAELADEDGHFSSLDLTTPCCARRTSLNELDFDGTFGIARFSIRLSGWAEISDEALDALGRMLGTRLKSMHTST